LKVTSLMELGKLDDAERTLLEGRAEGEQLGFDPILWQIDIALSGIAAATGDAARAAELRNEARAIIDRIASSIDALELRSSFLGLPDVAAVKAS
jgi:hypothetical protein